jgi:hypothetical protein
VPHGRNDDLDRHFVRHAADRLAEHVDQPPDLRRPASGKHQKNRLLRRQAEPLRQRHAIGVLNVVELFTVLFAVARTVGWIAQWKEMIEDPEQRIGRPRQLYVGPPRREFPAE